MMPAETRARGRGRAYGVGRFTLVLFVLAVVLCTSSNLASATEDIRLSAAEFLAATDPNLANFAGGSNPTFNHLFEPSTRDKPSDGKYKQEGVTKRTVTTTDGVKSTPVQVNSSKASGNETKASTSEGVGSESTSTGTGTGEDGEEEDVDSENNDQMQGRVPPFYMSAGRVKFYGGLLTFGHELHPARICRVLNACVRNDGTLVLPAWMRRYDEMLSFDCGIRRLEFSLTDTNPPPPLHNIDLFGSEIPPSELNKFLEHFMPQLVALDLLSGERDLAQGCHSRLGKGCFGFPLESTIRPALLINPAHESRNWQTSWVQSLIHMIPVENYKHRVRILTQGELFSMQSDDEVQCFRSAILTRSPRTKYSINPDMLRDLSIFKRNNFTKLPRIVRPPSEKRKKCHINVMFLNRRKPQPNDTLPLAAGFIPNIWRLRREIKRRVKKFAKFGLRMNISAVTLDKKMIRYQINAMQKSDILISGTTDYMSNMLFMRENSTIIELMAFGYYPRSYEKLARFTANVRYDQYIAHPDLKGFRKCMNVTAPPGSANFTLAKKVLKRFQKVAANYLISDNTHSYTLHNLPTKLDFVVPCARSQRLNSNATLFATAIVRHARLRCGIKLEDTFEGADSE